ncbi:MAG: type I methionyl aminopeptidase [Patescibacteria group bacterium]|mgnify:CR=1 FL=1
MIISKKTDIDALCEGGHLLATVLKDVVRETKLGVKTKYLDEVAESGIRNIGGRPSFKNYKTHGTKIFYPASLCVSINDEVVHAIPGDRILTAGDIVGLDIGMEYKGFYTDMAVTVGVGAIDKESERLINVTKKSLMIGIAEIRPGARVGDIGNAIQKYAEGEGFGIVRELVGHGVGLAVHEEPEIPNWGREGTGHELVEGMVLAIEPMLTVGSPRVKVSRDGWAWKTQSGNNAAHFEHTIIITKNGAKIITE